MNAFTTQLSKAAALLLMVTACVSARADNPKRLFNVRKATRTALVPKVKSAVTPTPLNAPANRVSIDERDILVDEDFSSFTAGTNDEPDTLNYLASSYYEPGIYIDPSLTKDGTWGGDFVHSAGGAAYLKTPNPMVAAVLMTPLGDYSGEITVKCKVKAMPDWIEMGEDETGEPQYGKLTGSGFYIYAGKGGFTSSEYANTDMQQYYNTRLYENKGWTEITVTFNNYDADNDGYICFLTNGAVLIDDVEVTTKATFIATPKIVGITDFQADNFTVEWQPVRKAYNYYIDLFKKVYTSDTDGVFSEDFENFTPQEGWTVTSNEVSDSEGMDGTKGLVMHNGDTISTPENGATYKTGDFYLKFVTPIDPKESLALLNIDVLTNTGWKNIGYYYVMAFTDGDVVKLADEMEGFADNYMAFRLRPMGLAEGEYIVVDNIDITTNRPSKLERVMGENSLNGSDYGADSNYDFYDMTDDCYQTSYTFTDLDPETEYYYGIRAHYVKIFSTPVNHHALGVCAPETLLATDIDSRGSFTANWNPAPKAMGYTVNMYCVTEVEEDNPDFILLDETFDKVDAGVTSATDWSSPELLGNYDDTRLDQYTTLPGWVGVGNTLAEGMLGCEESYSMFTEIVTPEFYVGNDDELKIYVKAYGDAGDRLMLKVDGTAYYIQFESAADGTGYIDGLCSIPVTSDNIQVHMSTYNYGAFMLDEIRFMQAVKKGDIVKTLVDKVETGAKTTSYTFTNLADYGFDTYGYSVTSYFEYEGKSTTSAPSNMVVVNLVTGDSHVSTGVEETVAEGDVREVARYSLNGCKLAAPQKGINIIRMSDGTTRKVLVK